jgi:phenylalanyl-tRNA synthetase beta chain
VATALMIDVCGARVLPGTVDVGQLPPRGAPIRLRPQRVWDLLGADIPQERCVEILESLGFEVHRAYEELDVTPPHWRRGDVTREVDLIEEVARIAGIDRLPATLPPRNDAAGRLTHTQRVRRRAEDLLVGRGLHEIVGWSFTDPGLVDRLRVPDDHAMRRVVTLENPLSEDQSVMRPTLLGSLFDAARHNRARGQDGIGIFESGTVYRAGPGPLADEHHALGVLVTGGLGRSDWRGGEPGPADFFAAKAVLAALLDGLRVDWSVVPDVWPALHAGRSASVLVGDAPVGLVGEVHPLVAQTWDLDQTAVFAVDLDRVAGAAPDEVLYTDVTSFPSVREDLAVVVPDDVPAASVLRVARAAGGPTLADVEIFDVYRGAQVGDGRVSLALHLEFRADDRTLTAAEVAQLRTAIATALADELGGELRA